MAAAFADLDNNDHQDLFVTTVRGGNVLFKNDGRGHFEDITQEAGLGLVAHSSGAFFFDYDNDGLLDLLVCNVGKYTTTTRDRTASTSGYPMPLMDTCTLSVTNIPCSIRTWATTSSRT